MLSPKPEKAYPLHVDVPYEPYGSRWKAFLRPVLVVPAAAFLQLVSQAAFLLAAFAWVVALLRGRYPVAMWRFNFAVVSWTAQTWAYLGLLLDDYPRLGPGTHPVLVRSDAFGPEGAPDSPPPASSRWRVGLRLLLVTPQLFLLLFVNIAGAAAVVMQWLVVLIGGRRPMGISGFIAAILRWNVRVFAYMLLLRDEYPPFNGAEDAATTGATGERISLAAGTLAVAVFAGAGVYSLLNPPEPVRETLAYAAVTAGDERTTLSSVRYEPPVGEGTVYIWLTAGGADPAPEAIVVEEGRRLVKFTWLIENNSDTSVRYESFAMEVEGGGETYEAIELRVDGRSRLDIERGKQRRIDGFFEVPEGLRLDRLTFRPILGASRIEVTFTH